MTEPLKLVLVDDQAMVRVGFRMVLDAQPDMVVVAEYADGEDAVRELLAPTLIECDVVIMDIRMARMNGVEATKRLVAGGQSARILVLTTFDVDEYVYAAVCAGASGFLLKDADPVELLAAIRAVAAGDAAMAPSATRRLLERFRPTMLDDLTANTNKTSSQLTGLTHRERDVFAAVGRGLSNAEIASDLWVTEATVKTHVSRILGKLHLRDRVQMVVLAYDTGVVKPQR